MRDRIVGDYSYMNISKRLLRFVADDLQATDARRVAAA